MALAVINPVMPTALAGEANGLITASKLEAVPGGGRLLTGAPARAWYALVVYCLGFGLPLTYTYGGTYRTYASQKSLFLSRYEPVSYARYLITPSSRRKLWPEAPSQGFSSKYWIKKQRADGTYPATAAVPGTSNHGLGIAIDTAFDDNTANGISPEDAAAITAHPQWPRFYQAVLDFGFSWELQSEPWHIRYVRGDSVTQMVLDLEAFLASVHTPVPAEPEPAPGGYGGGYVPPVEPVVEEPPPLEPPAPLPTNWTEVLVNNLPTIQVGSNGQPAKTLQALLVSKGHNLPIDGQFGQMTKDHVLWYQKSHGLTADGVVGRQTWTSLLTVS